MEEAGFPSAREDEEELLRLLLLVSKTSQTSRSVGTILADPLIKVKEECLVPVMNGSQPHTPEILHAHADNVSGYISVLSMYTAWRRCILQVYGLSFLVEKRKDPQGPNRVP